MDKFQHVLMQTGKNNSKMIKAKSIESVKFDDGVLKFNVAWEDEKLPNVFVEKESLVHCNHLIVDFITNNVTAIADAQARSNEKPGKLQTARRSKPLPKEIEMKPLSIFVKRLSSTSLAEATSYGAKRANSEPSLSGSDEPAKPKKSKLGLKSRVQLDMKRDEKQMNLYGRSIQPGECL